MNRNYRTLPEADVEPTGEDPVQVLYETITELLHLSESAGLHGYEIDLVLQRIAHDRKRRAQEEA